MPAASLSGNWASQLRRFVSPPAAVERCEFCRAPLAAKHPHLLEPATRAIACACPDCAASKTLPGSPYRRIPQQIRLLRDFTITEAQWSAFQIPIELVFLFIDSAAGRPVALYPGAAGAIQSQLSLDAWSELAAANPALTALQPDVEALLVNRTKGAREYYLAPIDCCYSLAGLIRTHWRGLSGGSVVWDEIDRYFARLRAEAVAGGAVGDG